MRNYPQYSAKLPAPTGNSHNGRMAWLKLSRESNSAAEKLEPSRTCSAFMRMNATPASSACTAQGVAARKIR
jgi:hypothetical protein